LVSNKGEQGSRASQLCGQVVFVHWFVWGTTLVESRLGWKPLEPGSHKYSIDPGAATIQSIDEFEELVPFLFKVDAEEQFRYGIERLIDALKHDPERKRAPLDRQPS
jgi:hypothetical protein